MRRLRWYRAHRRQDNKGFKMYKNSTANKQSKTGDVVSYNAYDIGYFILRTIVIALLTVSLAVAVPILWHGFYYMHISWLRLDEITPWSMDEIREAYKQMMDFCLWGREFATGVLKWSEEGRQHFADCSVLFHLDTHILIISVMLTAGLYAVKRVGAVSELRLAARGPLFWGGLIPIVLVLLTGLAVVFVDFDKAFVTFHHMFFPGKTNWLFNPETDEIIQILPEVYFRNCAILIAAVIAVFGGLMMYLDYRNRKMGSERWI